MKIMLYKRGNKNIDDNLVFVDVEKVLILDEDGKTLQFLCAEAKDCSIIMAHEPEDIAMLLSDNFENLEIIEDGNDESTTTSEAGRHDTEMGC